jgi:hypothetical protein
VDGDEEVAAGHVGEAGALLEADELVRLAGEDDLEALLGEDGAELLRDGERDVLCSARVTSLGARFLIARRRSRTWVGGARARMAPASGGPRVEPAGGTVLTTGRRWSASAVGAAAWSAGRSATLPDASSSSESAVVSPSSGAVFGVVTCFNQSGVSTGRAGACLRVSAGVSDRAGAVDVRAGEAAFRSAELPAGGAAACASPVEASRPGVERASVGVSRRTVASPFPALRPVSFGSGGSDAASALSLVD